MQAPQRFLSPTPIALAVMAALLPLAAVAQDTAPAAAAPASAPSTPSGAASAPVLTTLPAVRVKATVEKESATGPVQGYSARRTATATKTDTPLNEVPQAISVITADQVRDQSSSTIQDVLRYSAGVRHEMYGLDNRGDWFTLRGGSEGSVLLDGLRLPLTGWYGVVRNEPYAFERVEVLRGPASVIAGQNGPGGVVNLVSKRPQADAVREIELQVGNHSHRQAALDLGDSFGTDGVLSYRLLTLYKESGSQVDHADQRRSFVAPSLTWKPNAGTQLTAYAEYQKDDSANVNGFFPIEGTLRPGPNGFIPHDTFIGEPAWDRYGGERRRVGYELEQSLASDWTLRHRLRRDRVEGGMRSMYAQWWLGYADATGAPDPNGTYLNRTFYATDDKSSIVNGDLLLEGKLRFGPTQHTLLVGVEGMRSRIEQLAYDDSTATPLDVFNPVYGSFALPDLSATPYDTTASRTRAVGVLLQDQVKVGESVVLVAGLRRDRVKTTTEITPFGAAPETTEQDDSATSKRLGAVYLLPNGLSPYMSYSESFGAVAPSNSTVFQPKR
ncbi:MAG TPA: TonB-dependent siderophore receptor, partial [Rhizobacter sp.]